MPVSAALSDDAAQLSELVRKADPDRFLTTLFAPASARPVLLVLYAFNNELARAREVAREPGLALIRLQWWREVVEGAARAHEVATPLSAALAAGALERADLLAMIEAREAEIDPEFAGLESWLAWLRLGAGSLAVAAARALGGTSQVLERIGALGTGYGASGVLRNVTANARQRRCLLPGDVLGEVGLDKYSVIADPGAASLQPVRARLAAVGLALLGAPRALPRGVMAAGLPAVLARRDLRRAAQGRAAPRPRGLADRLAVTAAALARQV